MEMDLRVCQYNSIDGKRGKLINIFEDIESASLSTQHDKKKIRKAILTGCEIVTRRTIKDTTVNMKSTAVTRNISIFSKYFFSAGLEFERMPENTSMNFFHTENIPADLKLKYFKRIAKYDDTGNKIYDYENIWVELEEDKNILISNTGFVRTKKGKINKGYLVDRKYCVRISTEKGKRYEILEELIEKYFSRKPEIEELEEKDLDDENITDNNPIKIIKVDKDFNLKGYYKSYREAAKENNINRRTIVKLITTKTAASGYLWFSDKLNPEVINRYLCPNLEPIRPIKIDDKAWSVFIKEESSSEYSD